MRGERECFFILNPGSQSHCTHPSTRSIYSTPACPMPSCTDPTAIDFSSANHEWRNYLFAYFRQEYERSNGKVTLEQIFPVAQKKFLARNKACDIDLKLMANARKHKKEKNIV